MTRATTDTRCLGCGSWFPRSTQHPRQHYCSRYCSASNAGKISTSRNPRLTPMSGRVFGCWTVLRLATPEEIFDHDTSSHWLCRCTCGAERVFRGPWLRSRKSSPSHCDVCKIKPPSASEVALEKLRADNAKRIRECKALRTEAA